MKNNINILVYYLFDYYWKAYFISFFNSLIASLFVLYIIKKKHLSKQEYKCMYGLKKEKDYLYLHLEDEGVVWKYLVNS